MDSHRTVCLDSRTFLWLVHETDLDDYIEIVKSIIYIQFWEINNVKLLLKVILDIRLLTRCLWYLGL